MRLFIALELPDTVIAELETTRQRLQRSGHHPVKWVASTGFHLTLHFLGEVAEIQVPDILAVLEQARAIIPTDKPPHLHLTRAGAFPNARRPQILWMGVGGDLEALTRVYDTLGAGLEPLGFAPEQRPFHAHLTLGRMRRDTTPAQLAALASALAALPKPASIAWPLGVPILFKSTLTPKGALYHKVSNAE